MTTGTAASLPELFEQVCTSRPDALALVDGDRELTYAELAVAAAGLAGRLAEHGIRPGDLVGVRADRSGDVVVAILAVLRAGAVYVPLDPAYPTNRLRAMVEDTGVRLVVGDPGHADRFGVPVVAVEPGGPDTPAATPGRDDAAYVIYTSGSTGRPKGCVVTHGNVLALLDAALPLFDVGPDDRWTLFHSTSFDFSVWEIWGALATGATIVVVPEPAARSPELFLRLLSDRRVTVLNQVPSVFGYLALAHDQAGRPPLAVRYLVFGGESVDLGTVRRFVAGQEVSVVNMYGLTETTVHVTFKELTGDDLTGPVRSPIGRPLPHLTVELRDADGRPADTGEMWVSGAGVAAGYLNRPELTAERFVGGWYRSGDLARRLPGGELEYLGRADDQIKLRGFRIEPGEIESVLRDCPGVRHAAVTVARAGASARLLVAHLVTHEPIDTAAVRRHAAAALPGHMVPTRYHVVAELPLTASGKLDRAALQARTEGR